MDSSKGHPWAGKIAAAAHRAACKAKTAWAAARKAAAAAAGAVPRDRHSKDRSSKVRSRAAARANRWVAAVAAA